MTPPTVFLLGVDDLPTIPDFLRLGAVVVVAGDRPTLDRWQDEEHLPSTPAPRPEGTGLVLDLDGRRVLCDGVPLPFSDLEFCVVGALVARPGRARSFGELRAAGWGDGLTMGSDVEALRALIQRIRRKLQLAGADVTIEPVRGFGYRAAVGPPVPVGEPNGPSTGTGR